MQLQPVDHPLTDAEISERYAGLLREGLEAFKTDPWLLVEVAESATEPGVMERAQQHVTLRRAFDDGLTTPEAAALAGLTVQQVRRRWSKMGLRVSERPRRPVDPEVLQARRARALDQRRARREAKRAAEQRASERDRFDDLTRALTGLSLREASRRLECSEDRVRASWVRQGVEFNTLQAAQARTAAILPLLDEGLKPAEIMARLDVSRSHVVVAQRHKRAQRL